MTSKIYFFITFLILVLNCDINSQELIKSISNEFPDNERLFDVEINDIGTVVAVSSVPSPDVETSYGRVQIYSRTGDTFDKLSTEIITDVDHSFFGGKISLSGNGSIIAVSAESFDNQIEAVGAVYLYEILGNVIVPLDTLYGDSQFGAFGTSLDLNDSGNILIVGSKKKSAYVFQREQGKYNLQHEIVSEFFGVDFGRLVRINSEGNRVAILGLSFHGGNARPDVQIFNINSNMYEVIEEPIISESSDDRIEEFTFGQSGNIINLRINQNSSTFHNYIIGNSITNRDDEVASTLSFHDHIRFADNEDFIATNSTYGIHLYRYDNEKWTSTMDTIKVEASLIDMEISQNKEIVIVSTWGLNSDEDEVQIYKLNSTVSALDVKKEGFSLYPNPTSTYLVIENSEGLKYSIFNEMGKAIKLGHITGDTIDINSLENGQYFLELSDQLGKRSSLLKFVVSK